MALQSATFWEERKSTMVRRITLLLVGGGLVLCSLTCAPPPLRPTGDAAYRVAVEVVNPTIVLGPLPQSLAAYVPQVAAVLVTVKDRQGHPVEDIPVRCTLEPSWVGSATLSPSTTRTQRGKARCRFSDPRTTGVVHLLIRVGDPPARVSLTQVHLTVESYEDPFRTE
jgi:hypothetical protein